MHAFFHQHLEDLEHAFDMLGRCNFGSIVEDIASDFSGNGPSGRVGLRAKEGEEAGKSECGEERGVGLDGSEKEVEDVGLGGRGVEIGTVGVLFHFFGGVGEDLVNVV